MRSLIKALVLGLIGLAVCVAFPSVRVALWVTLATALVASWRSLRRRWFR